MTDHVLHHEEAESNETTVPPEAPKAPKKYRVLVDGLELTNKIGGAKGRPFKWDAGAEVNDAQVDEEEAKQLIEEKKLELIEE